MQNFRKGDLVIDRHSQEETGIVVSIRQNAALIYWVKGAGQIWVQNERLAPHPGPESTVLDEMFTFGD